MQNPWFKLMPEKIQDMEDVRRIFDALDIYFVQDKVDSCGLGNLVNPQPFMHVDSKPNKEVKKDG